MQYTGRGDALSIVAHELRNELSVLTTWAALLKRQERASPRLRQAAAALDRGTEIALRLCEDLGGLAAEVEPAFRPEPMDLRDVAVAGAAALVASARRKRVRVVQQVAADPVWVLGDRVRLGEVLSNLLRNALTFTRRGGTITVEVCKSAGLAHLVVADTGGGISPTFLPRAFEKFTREPGRDRRGRGLGLYIVRSLVELHKGSVEVHSGGPMRGTRVVVTLSSAAH